MIDIKAILIPLGSSILTAIITSYITVRLTLKQFYSQKWWEKKEEAYSEIIEVKHNTKSGIKN